MKKDLIKDFGDDLARISMRGYIDLGFFPKPYLYPTDGATLKNSYEFMVKGIYGTDKKSRKLLSDSLEEVIQIANARIQLYFNEMRDNELLVETPMGYRMKTKGEVIIERGEIPEGLVAI